MRTILEGRAKRARALLIAAASLLLVATLDWVTGPTFGFSVFYLAPIAVVAWTSERWLGVVAAFIAAGVWFVADKLGAEPYATGFIPLWNAMVRLAFFLIVALLLHRLQGDARERSRLIAELRSTLANVKTLSGLLPICAWCKNVRDDEGYWQQVESYVQAHSGATFTHGICPSCAEKVKREMGLDD